MSSKLSRELMIEQIVITCGVSRSDVLSYLKTCSFSDYVRLAEATADRNPWLTSGTSNNNTANSTDAASVDATSDKTTNQQPYKSNIDRIGGEFSGDDQSDKGEVAYAKGRNDGQVYQIENEFSNEYEVVDQEGSRKRVNKREVERYDSRDTTNTYTKIKSFFKGLNLGNDSSFQKGKAFAAKYMEDLEISRMRELAGIEEVSIIGNTADSHKPTVQLRKKERIKRDQRDRKRENKGYQPEQRLKRDVSADVMTNIRRDLK